MTSWNATYSVRIEAQTNDYAVCVVRRNGAPLAAACGYDAETAVAQAVERARLMRRDELPLWRRVEIRHEADRLSRV